MSQLKSQHFILDFAKYQIGTEVTISGIIEKKSKFSKYILGVWIRDITGQTLVKINTNSSCYNQEYLHVKKIVRITGKISKSNNDKLILTDISEIELLISDDIQLFEDLNEEINEFTSKLLTSRIIKKISDSLSNEGFIEFESKVLSNHSEEKEGLEPLRVIYSGFGSPAKLTISPSSQILEFLSATLFKRAFTVSTSFSQSYRFPNSAAEFRVIVAKGIDIDFKSQILLLENLTKKIYKDLIGKKDLTFLIIDDEINFITKDSDFFFMKKVCNIPVVGKNWNTIINTIIKLVDKDQNIIAECTREHFSSGKEISTVTIYPTQYLQLVKNQPKRQLQDLMRIYNGL